MCVRIFNVGRGAAGAGVLPFDQTAFACIAPEDHIDFSCADFQRGALHASTRDAERPRGPRAEVAPNQNPCPKCDKHKGQEYADPETSEQQKVLKQERYAQCHRKQRQQDRASCVLRLHGDYSPYR